MADFHCHLPCISRLERTLSCAQTLEAPHNKPFRPSIHILDDDSLLHVFHLYRPVLLDDDTFDGRILVGKKWVHERWWYKLAHVCRRWRYLILGSASHLGLRLICTHGTPVADMLAHSPPLPLVIDHVRGYPEMTAEDEEGILLALRHRSRIRRIRLQMRDLNLERLIMAIDEEFPRLEYLNIALQTKHNIGLILPSTFQAPHLRYLILRNFTFPGSSLLTAAVGLVSLWLLEIRPSAYFSPNNLLQRLSLMPQLENLKLTFHSPVPNHDVERHLFNTPIVTNVTLPSLRRFAFGGVSAYLEAVLPWMTTPLLEKLEIGFFNQLTFSLPFLLQFIRTTEYLKFCSAKLNFNVNEVTVFVYPREGTSTHAFCMQVYCGHLDCGGPDSRVWETLNIVGMEQ
ncbi:hypothetical protein BJV74DRAFT_65526 [Russula compacta]|nr:hypothetical protein BJV74DRAFT_65526 [Russula compacta]